MEIAAAGEDHKMLRAIARNLLEMAQKPDATALPAIREIADRMDGKPVQSVEVGEPGDFDHMSDSELMAVVAEEAGKLGVVSPLKKSNGRGNGTAH